MLALALAALLLAGVCSGQGAFNTPQVNRPAYQSCRCVPPSSCRASIIHYNTLERSICKKPEVCCPHASITTPLNVFQTEARTISPPRRNKYGLECGYRNASMIASNISAPEENEANFGEFPWIIAILKLIPDGRYVQIQFHCGGSLIHPRVVLTAAHYMDDSAAENFRARAGEWAPHSTAEPYPHQDRKVSEIIIHERFNKAHLTFDAALLILESSFVISPHINPVCLPNAEMLPNSATCYVAGWGVDAFESRVNPGKLKKIDLQVLSTSQCNDMLRTTILGPYYSLHSSFICAGGEEGKDACTGDGGSALMCPIPDNEEYYYQAGIVSWGIGCGQEKVPGVYANVLRFRLWIDKVLKEKYLLE